MLIIADRVPDGRKASCSGSEMRRRCSLSDTDIFYEKATICTHYDISGVIRPNRLVCDICTSFPNVRSNYDVNIIF